MGNVSKSTQTAVIAAKGIGKYKFRLKKIEKNLLLNYLIS